MSKVIVQFAGPAPASSADKMKLMKQIYGAIDVFVSDTEAAGAIVLNDSVSFDSAVVSAFPLGMVLRRWADPPENTVDANVLDEQAEQLAAKFGFALPHFGATEKVVVGPPDSGKTAICKALEGHQHDGMPTPHAAVQTGRCTDTGGHFRYRDAVKELATILRHGRKAEVWLVLNLQHFLLMPDLFKANIQEYKNLLPDRVVATHGDCLDAEVAKMAISWIRLDIPVAVSSIDGRSAADVRALFAQ